MQMGTYQFVLYILSELGVVNLDLIAHACLDLPLVLEVEVDGLYLGLLLTTS